MAGSVVQSKSAAQNTGLATVTVSWNTAATAGNLLVIAVGSDDYRTVGGIPSGFTESTGCKQETFLGSYVWWKIAAGGEASTTYTIASASASCWMTMEISGLVTASVLDLANGQLAASSGSSYTTPAIVLSAGGRFLIGYIGGSSSGSTLTTKATWINSFTEVTNGDIWTTLGSGTRDSIGWATQSVTGNGSTSFSTGATWDGAVSAQARTGIILAFKEATGSTPIGVAESGSGSDTLAVAVAVPVAEAASAAQSLAEMAAGPLGDTGAGVDTLNAVATVSRADAGLAADSLGVGAVIALAEGGTGADAIDHLVITPLADTSTGADTLATGVASGLADAGSAGTALAVAVGLGLAEAGTATTALTETVTAGLADSGSAAETILAGVPIALAEAGSAAQALTVTATSGIGESGTGVTTLGTAVALELAESGASAAALSVGAGLGLAESGSTTDTLVVLQTRAVAESGSALESISVIAMTSEPLFGTASVTGQIGGQISRPGELAGNTVRRP